MHAMGLGAAAIALAELGGARPAGAEDAFTIASTGGSWGDGLKQAYVLKADFEKRFNAQVSYAHMIDSVIATKVIAQCGNPPYTVSGAHGEAEAILMADGSCVEPYDLNIVTNYKDIYETARLPSRRGMDAWWASFMMLVFGLTYNTKEAGEADDVRGPPPESTRTRSASPPMAGMECTGCTPSTRASAGTRTTSRLAWRRPRDW